MKVAAYLLGLGVLAGGISFGAAGLQAQQSTLMNFCPARPGSTSCSAAATMLVSAGNPSDDELIAYITAIADAQRNSRGCGDTAAGLSALVGAIDSEATKGLAQQLVDRLCGVTRTADTGGGGDGGVDEKTLHDIVFGTDKGSSPPPTTLGSSSSGSSGLSSGSSGQSSSGSTGSSSSGSTGSSSSGSSGASGSDGESCGASDNPCIQQ